MAEKEYKTYEDLVGAPRQDAREEIDFAHGKMFALPDWVTWWTAGDAWGKATKKEDAKEHTIDVRIVGFVMDGAEFWPKGMRDRVGGLVYTFPFTHHRDPNRDRHLCLKALGEECPRCEKFFEMREQTKDMERPAAWEKIKVFSQKFSGLVFGYVGGGKELKAFEFGDTRPGKGYEKDPTFFQRVVSLATDKSVPAASRIDPLFYSYGPRAQILRLKFNWVVPQKGKEYWQLTNIYKVGAEDGAPSTAVDSSVAERIRPWEWMDVKGERERMLAGVGEAKEAAVDLDKMDYKDLLAYAVENQMNAVLAEMYQDDELADLRAAIKKESGK